MSVFSSFVVLGGVAGDGDVSLYAVEDERQGTRTPLWYVEIFIPPFGITEIMLNP